MRLKEMKAMEETVCWLTFTKEKRKKWFFPSFSRNYTSRHEEREGKLYNICSLSTGKEKHERRWEGNEKVFCIFWNNFIYFKWIETNLIPEWLKYIYSSYPTFSSSVSSPSPMCDLNWIKFLFFFWAKYRKMRWKNFRFNFSQAI